MKDNYFVSAYAASPSCHAWNPIAESRYFHELAKKPQIIGIEHPFVFQSEKYPITWLTEHVPANWSLLITTLPVFMDLSKTHAFFGLASTLEKDRADAVKLMAHASHYVCELNRAFGRKVVSGIHIHSLPCNDSHHMRGSKAALKQSLREMKDLDWDGAAINLEHCDAYILGQRAEKGFLLLEDEIEILCEVGGYGMILNWARSAIEGRSVNTPLLHLDRLNKAGLLKGFFFSGCSDRLASAYGFWKDTHMPPKNFINSVYLREESLLGADEISQAMTFLKHADPDVYLGIKVSDLSFNEDLNRKVGLNIETIDALEQVRHHICHDK